MDNKPHDVVAMLEKETRFQSCDNSKVEFALKRGDLELAHSLLDTGNIDHHCVNRHNKTLIDLLVDAGQYELAEAHSTHIFIEEIDSLGSNVTRISPILDENNKPTIEVYFATRTEAENVSNHLRATVRQADTSEYYIRVGEIRSRTLFNNSPVTHSVYTTLTGSVADSVMQDLPSSMDIDGAADADCGDQETMDIEFTHPFKRGF